MTREAFLAWEERQELRYEFDGIRPVAMTGGTMAHAVILQNLSMAVGNRLRGGPCRFYGSHLKVDVGHGYRYPDGFVAFTPVVRASTIVTDPVVVFEVLSPSTASVDQITKNREYAAIPSVRRYVLLAQDRVGATVFERAGDDWIGHVIADEATLDLPEIGIALPLAELYEGVAADDEEA